jgi:hypothetical protein
MLKNLAKASTHGREMSLKQFNADDALVHIPKFRNGTEKILANASTADFSVASDIILGYALNVELSYRCPTQKPGRSR